MFPKVYGYDLPSVGNIFNNNLVPLKIGHFEFPHCIVNINGDKVISETPVIGLDGTVKEFLGIGDYKITVKAVFNDLNYDRVQLKIEPLIELWKRNIALPVVCPKLEKYDIENVVIKNIDHPETVAMPGTETIILSLVSDFEYEFDIDEI